jgi:PAT family beta-lactamase induction signal transducer AmpG
MAHQAEQKTQSQSLLKRIFSDRRMLIILLMGFSSGLPLLLVGGTLRLWMRREGVDLSTIGLVALIGIPYSFKFVWAPLLDHFRLKFLGRRRGWLMVFQLMLAVAILSMAQFSPSTSLLEISILAFLIAFFSASQDIVVDAYRREILREDELGAGSGLAVTGARFGLLASGSIAIMLADWMSWNQVYMLMAALMIVGMLATLFAPEPEAHADTPKNLGEAVVGPFVDYFKKKDALLILLFIVLYKMGDQLASDYNSVLYADLSFSNTVIGSVGKFFGFWSTLVGSLIGGFLVSIYGKNKCLWVFGFLQAISTLGFSLLTLVPGSVPALAGVVAFENLAGGMGSAAYVTLMASLTNRKYTGTQYALLTSLMSVPRIFLSTPGGWLVEQMGWFEFYLICALLAIPGLLLLHKIAPWKESR